MEAVAEGVGAVGAVKRQLREVVQQALVTATAQNALQ